jgi:hypothetical protein
MQWQILKSPSTAVEKCKPRHQLMIASGVKNGGGVGASVEVASACYIGSETTPGMVYITVNNLTVDHILSYLTNQL